MILEPAEVRGGVVESVGVVDAQAVNLSLGDQAKHQGVRGLEDVFTLHRQRGQVVDVKEAAVVDLVRAHPPVRKAIALVLEQVIHELEAVAGRRACRRSEPRSASIKSRIGWLSAARAASRRLITSFSRWRSATFSGSVSELPGRFRTDVRML